MTKILAVLAVLCAYILGYLIGTFEPSVCYYDTLPQIYKEYNHIQIYEDGSYIGERRGGLDVEGCIEGAVCND